MKKLLILFICASFFLGCEDESIISSSPVDLSSCFSPEFGMIEAEQFFYNLQFGELKVNLDNTITGRNLGYSIQEGVNTIFIYRHFLENSFQIDDDEIEIRILFEIDPNLNSFEINSIQEFEKSKCIYSKCGIALQTITGNINGCKNANGNWFVNANLRIQIFNQVKEVSINEVFRF